MTAIVATLMVSSASAEPTEQDIGSLTYQLEIVDGVATATVLGLTEDAQATTNLTVPANVEHDGTQYTVIAVADSAFPGTVLESIAFAGPLESVGAYAFAGVDSLTSVHFQGDVDIIKPGSFVATGIESLTFDGRVRVIGDTAFNQHSLTEFSAPPGLESIGTNAFSGGDLVTVTFPFPIEHLGTSVFADNSITSIEFTGEVGTIGDGLLSGNNDLAEVIFRDAVDVIGSGAFSNTGVETVVFDGDIGTIESGAFSGNAIKELTFSGDVGMLSSGAFGDQAVETVIFHGAVDEIKSGSFQSFSITTLEFHSEVGTIGSGAFGESGIEELVFPGPVIKLDDGAFRDSLSLTSVTFMDQVTTIGNSVFAGSATETVIFHGPVGAIGTAAFADAPVKDLIFHSTVGSIGTSAFVGHALRHVDIPEGVNTINGNAFSGNSDLESVFMLGPVPTVGSTIFGDGDPLVRYYWRHSVDAGVVGGYTSSHWEGYPSQAVVVVDFVLPEPFGIDAVELDAHTQLSAPGPIPGFDVIAWTTDEAGTEVWEFSDPVTTDLTLYAHELRVVFSDVPVDHHFFTDIAWLVFHGITTGYSDDTFRPAAHVSRQAMAAFLYRMAGEPSFTAPVTATFTDVGTGHDFFHEVEWLATTGITAGYDDDTFRPTAHVSRQALAAFLYRMAGEPSFTPPATASFSDVGAGHDFFHDIEWLATTGITTGYDDGTFRPTAHVSRQAMAAFLQRYDAL